MRHHRVLTIVSLTCLCLVALGLRWTEAGQTVKAAGPIGADFTTLAREADGDVLGGTVNGLYRFSTDLEEWEFVGLANNSVLLKRIPAVVFGSQVTALSCCRGTAVRPLSTAPGIWRRQGCRAWRERVASFWWQRETAVCRSRPMTAPLGVPPRSGRPTMSSSTPQKRSSSPPAMVCTHPGTTDRAGSSSTQPMACWSRVLPKTPMERSA